MEAENFIAEISPYLAKLSDVLKDVRESVEKQQDQNEQQSNLQ